VVQLISNPSPATFTSLEALRIRGVALALALAGWSVLIAFLFVAFAPLRRIAVAGFVLSFACVAVSFVLGWSLYCPWCCSRLFFVSSMANSPSLGQLLRLYLPRQIVVSGRIMCPHCHSRFFLKRS
jgi:hypothetical protein